MYDVGMPISAQWFGGPHDGAVVELPGPANYAEFTVPIDLDDLLTSSLSARQAKVKTIRVPLVYMHDMKRWFLIWNEVMAL